jgi:hypothetical protein
MLIIIYRMEAMPSDWLTDEGVCRFSPFGNTGGWYKLLRSRYGFSFFLLGQEQTEQEPEEVPDTNSENALQSAQAYESGEATLPGAIEGMQDEHDLVDIAIQGPSDEDVVVAENEIRRVLEEGRAEEIKTVLTKYVKLVSLIQPDLLWASELVHMRLLVASR